MKKFFIIAIAVLIGFSLLLLIYTSYKNSNPVVFSPTEKLGVGRDVKNGTLLPIANWTSDMAQNDGGQKPEITSMQVTKLNNVMGRKYHVALYGKHLLGFEGGTWLGFYHGSGDKFDVEALDQSYSSDGKIEFDLGETTCVNGYQMAYKGDPCDESITIKSGEWAVVAKPWGNFSNTFLVNFPQ